MDKSVKLRIYPNKQQRELINKTFGCCRLIYNKGLALRNDAFLQGSHIGYSQTCRMVTQLKALPEFQFLCEVDSIALQQTLKDLDYAFKYFFSGQNRCPKFKCKHENYQSYKTYNRGSTIRIVGNKIKLPKLGLVKIRRSIQLDRIKYAHVEQVPSGKYYVSLCVDFTPNTIHPQNSAIGVDVGIASFYTGSNGVVVPNPKFLTNSQKRCARAQRRLARKHIGSNNYRKQRIKTARIIEKALNQKTDFLQKQSTKLICENQTICVEDLNVIGLMRNHNIAHALREVSWSSFFRMLEYKSRWYGNTFIKIPRFYPSSQLCSICGVKNPILKNLKIRNWECPNCHTLHNRDVNASINILRKGLELI